MSGMQFIKMSGSGNDFIFFDGRMVQRSVEEWQELARKLCRRGLSVGADGLVVLQPVDDHPEVQFEWLFLNADGSEAEMCGNAGRCAAHVAWKTRLVGAKEMAFMTLAGVIHASLTDRGAKVQLTDPTDLRPAFALPLQSGPIQVGFVNTGVPHTVWFVDDAGAVDMKTWGREVRFHDEFKPAGTNANVAEVLGPDEIRIRTYERGVEDETLACGTGCVAAAILAAERDLVRSPVRLHTKGGETLTVYFERDGERFHSCYLEGRVREVYAGQAFPDALAD